MGIYKWYAYFSQQEAFTKSIIRYAPSNINIFAIDLNGIIHTNAQKIFGYGEGKKTDAELGLVSVNGKLVMPQEKYDELEQELFKAIFDDIVGLTKTIAPSLLQYPSIFLPAIHQKLQARLHSKQGGRQKY